MSHQQHMMYHDDKEPSFQQPEHAPYEANTGNRKKRKGGLYKPPFFFANATSLIFALIGLIFFFISFGGTSWYVVPPENTIVPKTFGLWRLCVRSECVVDMTNDYMIKRYLIDTSEANSNNGKCLGYHSYYYIATLRVSCYMLSVVVLSLVILKYLNLILISCKLILHF
jgi:hypothetical protein